MADYSTHSGGGGRWIIFGGLALGILALLAIFATGPERTDPAAMPPDGTAATEPAVPDAAAPDAGGPVIIE